MNKVEVYSYVKDFAGPVVTTVAAVVAAYITWSIQQQNKALVEERLRHDLFDRRYQVYKAARQLLEYLLTHSRYSELVGVAEVNGFLSKISEAKFVCSPPVVSFCETIVETYNRAWRSAFAVEHGTPTSAVAEEAADIQRAKSGLHDKLVDEFTRDLRLRRDF